MRNYITHICVATVIVLVIIAGFNTLIDPYKIWNAAEIHGLNKEKSQLEIHERIYKTVGLLRHRYNAVILGTSRSEIGLNPNHPAFGSDAINLAIAGQPYRETRMLFDKLNNRETIKTVVIGLDFFGANVFLPYPVDYIDENFSNERSWQLRFSGAVLMDSVSTVAKRNVHSLDTFTEKGQLILSDEHVKNGGGNRAIMSSTLKGTMLTYLPPSSCSFGFASTSKKSSPLEEFRAIFSRAHRDHVALKLFISPSHSWQWETLAAVGLWGKWEEWKHRLVKINEEESQQAGQLPFPLWDFSGYNTISTENVPALGDTENIMHWYIDSSHYTSAAGDLLLDRIFNFKSPERSAPDDFGVLLTSRNLDAHLANIRADRERYRQSHPGIVAEIESMAREVAKTQSCHSINQFKSGG